jgi:hypothetical protein
VYLCVLVALMLILFPVSTGGQENLSIAVTTDKQTYALGQTILIAVSVQQFGAPVASVTVFYEVQGPQNQVITSGFGITDSTGKYMKQITIGNDLSVGSYTVTARVSANGQNASAISAFQTVPEFASDLILVQLFAFFSAIALLRSSRKRESHSVERGSTEADNEILQAEFSCMFEQDGLKNEFRRAFLKKLKSI